MLIWYQNSILASIISMTGCGGVIAGVTELFKDASSRELSTGACIGFIVVGVLLAIWGKLISANKEEKQRAAQAAASNTSTSTAPVQTRQTAVYAPRASAGAYGSTLAAPAQKVKTSLSLGTFCYLLSAIFSFWGFYLYRLWERERSMGGIYGTQDFDRLAVLLFLSGVCCLLCVFACGTTKKRQNVFGLFVAGFLGLIAVHTLDTITMYDRYGFTSHTLNDGSTIHAMTTVPIMRVAAFFLMLLLSIFAMKNNKERLGGFVRWFWFLPTLLLAVAFSKPLVDNKVIDMLSVFLSMRNAPFRPEIMDALAHTFLILGVLFSSFAFRSFCKKTEAAPVQPAYAPAASQPAPYTAPVYAAPAQSQPAPRYTAYESAAPAPAAAPAAPAPQPAAQGNSKQLQAYKDLLDCGILTQEEYDQKIRELM